MTADEVSKVRGALGLTQSQLAQLLGVHVLTVSKWERGLLQPNAYQSSLLESFAEAQRRRPDVGSSAIGLLLGAGIAAAIFLLLKAVLDDDEPRRGHSRGRRGG